MTDEIFRGLVAAPSRSVYKKMGEVTPIAEALDGCSAPYSSAGHSIYAFMSQLDFIVDNYLDGETGFASTACYLADYLGYVSSALGVDKKVLQERALELSEALRKTDRPEDVIRERVQLEFFKGLV